MVKVYEDIAQRTTVSNTILGHQAWYIPEPVSLKRTSLSVLESEDAHECL